MLYPVNILFMLITFIHYQLKVFRCLLENPWRGRIEWRDTTLRPGITPGNTVEPATLGGIALPGVQQR